MFTRREILCALIAMMATLSAVAWAQSTPKPALKSAVFDWDKIEAQSTKSGEKRSFFDGSTATLTQLECHATTVNPGEATHAPIAQAWDELVIVKEGTLEAQIDGQPHHFGQGSVLFQAVNDLHGVKNVGDKPATYYVIKIVADGAAKIKSE